MTRTSRQNPPIRIGAISFVNTIPVYSAYQPNPAWALHYEVPARLNAMIRAGELEVSPVSSACYLREQEKLVLLDDLSVSSYGAVESVIFLSRRPLGVEMLDFPQINIPNDSETSVALLTYLLQDTLKQDIRPWFHIYEAADYQSTLETSGNALVIGDNALMLQDALQRGALTGFHCYDLSTLWKAKTGLPFVFAVWVANRAWAEANPEALHDINQALCAARNRFYADATSFEVGLRQAQDKSGLPRATLERYYRQCLDYRLDTPHRQSLSQFARVLKSSGPTAQPESLKLEPEFA